MLDVHNQNGPNAYVTMISETTTYNIVAIVC